MFTSRRLLRTLRSPRLPFPVLLASGVVALTALTGWTLAHGPFPPLRLGWHHPSHATPPVDFSADTACLFVGSSHIRDSVVPEVFPLRTVNAGTSGVPSAVGVCAALKHLPRMNKMRVVVCEISGRMSMKCPSEYAISNTQGMAKLGLAAEDLPDLIGIDVASMPYLARLQSVTASRTPLTPINVHRAAWEARRAVAPERSDGIDADGPVDTLAEAQRRIGAALPRVLGDDAVAEKCAGGAAALKDNAEALAVLARRLREQGVTVVFVQAPLPELYRRAEPDPFRRAYRFMEAAAKQAFGPDVVIWNDAAHADFGPQDFKDAVHLNRRGAEKYSRLLAERIGRLDLPPPKVRSPGADVAGGRH